VPGDLEGGESSYLEWLDVTMIKSANRQQTFLTHCPGGETRLSKVIDRNVGFQFTAFADWTRRYPNCLAVVTRTYSETTSVDVSGFHNVHVET